MPPLSMRLALCIWLILTSCQINRTVKGHKHGRWVHTSDIVKKDFKLLTKLGYSLPQGLNEGYYYKGRYRQGSEVGTWRYYMNGKLVRKEKYRGAIAYVRFYNSNGKIDCEGKTFLDSSDKLIHWYFTGFWKCYDENGSLVVTRNYEKGEMVTEEYHVKE